MLAAPEVGGKVALRKCRECGQQISTKAKVCPNCGAPGPSSTSPADTAKGCGCLAVLVLIGAVILGSHSGDKHSPEAPEQGANLPPAPVGGLCRDDWTKCKDNSDIANNYRNWVEAKVACEMAAEEKAKFGSPTWPWLAFGSYLKGRSYLQAGDAVLIEPDAQFDNGLGSKEHVRVVCHYDLPGSRVTDIMVMPSH